MEAAAARSSRGIMARLEEAGQSWDGGVPVVIRPRHHVAGKPRWLGYRLSGSFLMQPGATGATRATGATGAPWRKVAGCPGSPGTSICLVHSAYCLLLTVAGFRNLLTAVDTAAIRLRRLNHKTFNNHVQCISPMSVSELLESKEF